MAYNEFSFDKATEQFSLRRNENTSLFVAIAEVAPGQPLAILLEDQVPLALAIGNEKARSEFIIAPILAEARRQADRMVSVFSGALFDIAPEQGLAGYCDFIFSRSPELFSLKAPVLMIVEAKKEDIPGGFGQCVAEMVAARIFNERSQTGITTIYGVVTTGDNWRFLKLEGDAVFVDLAQYQIAQLPKILGILGYILQGRNAGKDQTA
jgi:hypothetical protein